MTFAQRFFQWSFLGLSVLLLSACAETQLASHYAKKMNKQTGTYKVGNPYKVAGVWYYPQEDYSLVETGIASWYGPDFHGKKTANGEPYDQNELTAAHRTLPMPSLVRVTNLENGRAIVVRINDRGPFLRGRIIDVSRKGAELLGFINRGTARVRVEVLPDESRRMAEAAKRGLDTSRMSTADLNRISLQKTGYAPPASTPVVSSGAGDYALPDSLKTPTITVEELSPQGRTARRNPVSAPVSGHMTNGKFMPDPVVSNVPVSPTGIFVQAGAFASKSNADALKQKLSGIAPVTIDTITSAGRQLYRVRLGPVGTVSEADRLLDKVIRAGNASAKVVRH